MNEILVPALRVGFSTCLCFMKSPNAGSARAGVCAPRALLLLLLAAASGFAQQPVTQLWKVATSGKVVSSPAIGEDGTIYVGCAAGLSAASADVNDGWLYAISPAGTTNWIFYAGAQIRSTPAIGSNATIYVGCMNGKLYALDPQGTTNWYFHTGGQIPGSPALGLDGTIYVGAVSNNLNRLYAIRPDGTSRWVFNMGAVLLPLLPSMQFSSPAVGPDGTIYVGSIDKNLYAINPNGTTNWVVPLSVSNRPPAETYSSPAVGADGTIYLGADNFYLFAIDRHGQKKWQSPTGNFVESSPAIAGDGAIYVGSLDGNLYVHSPGGARLRTVNTGGLSGSPALGADGTVYVGSFNPTRFYALGPVGTSGYGIRWQLSTADEFFSSPAIGSDGTVYVGGGSNLYAIRATNALMASSWPMFRRDVRRDSRSVRWGISDPAAQDGVFSATLEVAVGATNRVEYSGDLIGWSVFTNLVPINSPVRFVDSTAGEATRRYYRLVVP